jgi:broad specificity phosphatase PhoE
MELSPRGHAQAAALAKFLHTRPFDACYASPMKRVQQTLAPLLGNGLPHPAILPDLREVDFGDWTGLRWEEVPAKFGVSALDWLLLLENQAIPGAECAQSLRARLEPCLRRILDRHPGQQVAIACHGGVIRMLLSIVLGWPLSRMEAFEIEYASVTQVIGLPQRPQLRLVNFTPWRESPA